MAGLYNSRNDNKEQSKSSGGGLFNAHKKQVDKYTDDRLAGYHSSMAEAAQEQRKDEGVRTLNRAITEGIQQRADEGQRIIESTPRQPSYGERVREEINKFPAILRPIAAPIAALAEAPWARAIGYYSAPEPIREEYAEKHNLPKPEGAAAFVGQAIAPFAVQGAGFRTGVGLYRGANQLLGRVFPGLSTTRGGRIAQEFIAEAAAGAPVAAGTEFSQGSGNPRQAAINAAIGAGTGGAMGGLSRGVAEVADIGKQAVADTLLNRLSAATALDRAANTPQYAGRLKLPSAGEDASRVIESIRPEVNTRMTPPLESEKALREWIKPYLGDVSNNELRKLSYDDLAELADEARRGMNMYDVAVNVARERGINLPQRFEGRRLSDIVSRDASRRAYGFPQPELPQASRAVTSNDPAPNVPTRNMSWFERLFGLDQGMGISPLGSRKSNNIVTTEQQIVNNPLRREASGLLDSARQAGRAAYQANVDYISPLKQINQQTYDAAMDVARANSIANNIIRDKFVDLEGNVIGNSLNDVMKPSRALGKKVDDYLILRHAISRMGRGERVYDDALKMTPEKARQMVETLEKRYPQLRQIGQMWDEYNTNLLDSGVREGLITQAARDAMREQNPNYASMRRQFSTGEKLTNQKWGIGQAFSGQKAPIKEVSPTGSTRRIVSPIRSAMEQTQAWKQAELRNRVMQEVVGAIQRDPDGMKGIAEIVKKPNTSFRDLDQALREGGSEEFLEQLNNDFRSLFSKARPGDESVVRAMIQGRPVYVKVHNTEAVKALMGMGQEQSGIVLRAMEMLSNATKRGATGLFAPMFAVKSVTADTVQAAIQSPNAIAHLLVDVPHAFISSIADVMRIPGLRNLAQEFRRSGGEYSSLLRGDRQVNRGVSSLRRPAYLSPQGVGKGLVTTAKSPFQALEKVSDISENLNRMAAYRRIMRGKERTPENVRAAINAARESTVNFSRRGSAYRQTEAIVPYNNAAIQGILRVVRTFKNPASAAKAIAGIGTLIVAPKLYEYARFHDDPDYQEFPARERYRNIIISKNADGTFNKQYMPPEYMAIGAFITDVLDDVIGSDPQAYKGSLDAIVNAYTPPLVSGLAQGATQGGGVDQSIKGGFNATVAGPAFALGSNQSFTGAPIVPQRLQGASPRNQYDERTSGIAKWIGDKLGYAPMKVDYLLRAYGGDPARLVLPLTSEAGAGTPRNTLLRNFIVDPVFTNTLSNDYYTAKEAFDRAKKDNTDFGDPLPSWYSEDLHKLFTSRTKTAATTKLSDLNAQKREVNAGKASAELKAQQLRSIQAQINDIYADINSKIASKGFQFPNR